MKVINLISISLLSLGIFGNNSSWSMESEDDINNSNQGGMTNGPQQNSAYNPLEQPMNVLNIDLKELNNNKVFTIPEQSSHPLAEYDNKSLSEKLNVIQRVTDQVRKTAEYKNISQDIKNEADDLTSEIIKNLQKSMTEKFAKRDNIKHIINTTLVEFAYQMTKLQYTHIGFLKNSQLEKPNIDDNLEDK